MQVRRSQEAQSVCSTLTNFDSTHNHQQNNHQSFVDTLPIRASIDRPTDRPPSPLLPTTSIFLATNWGYRPTTTATYHHHHHHHMNTTITINQATTTTTVFNKRTEAVACSCYFSPAFLDISDSVHMSVSTYDCRISRFFILFCNFCIWVQFFFEKRNRLMALDKR